MRVVQARVDKKVRELPGEETTVKTKKSEVDDNSKDNQGVNKVGWGR